MDFTGPVHASGQLELNVARLAGTGDQRDIRGEPRRSIGDSQLTEEVEQIGDDLRRGKDCLVQRRQLAHRATTAARPSTDYQRARLSDRPVDSGDTEVGGERLLATLVSGQLFQVIPMQDLDALFL